MGDFEGTTTVATSAQALFDYLSDVANLPRYFTRMTSAAPAGDEQVRTTAKMPDGREVQGEAWFRVDAGAKHLEWGSEGPSSYGGSLDVQAGEDGSRVHVRLHTSRVADGDTEVQHGIQETLANIKRLGGQDGAAR